MHPPAQRRRRHHRRLPANIASFSRFSRTAFLCCSVATVAAKSSHRDSSSFSSSSTLENRSALPPNHRKIVHSESEEEESEDNDLQNEDDDQERIVQVDFAFFDPKPSSFHGVKLLLERYLVGLSWDLRGFVDLILEQTTVGTIVKASNDDNGGDDRGTDNTDDGDGIFAVISALNLARYAEERCIKEIKEFLMSVCCDESLRGKLRNFLEEQARGVGLLVSSRFMNFPYEVVPQLYQALFNEVSWATEDEPTEELRDSFHFKYYLLITSIYESTYSSQSKPKRKRIDDEAVIYIKAEDEIFHELSTLSFTFSMSSEKVPQEMKGYKKMGLVMIVKSEEIPTFLSKLESLVKGQ